MGLVKCELGGSTFTCWKARLGYKTLPTSKTCIHHNAILFIYYLDFVTIIRIGKFFSLELSF